MKCFCLVFVFISAVHLESSNASGRPENLASSPCTDQNHLLLAPGVLTAGGTNRACISRFHPEGSAQLLLKLFTEDGQTVTAKRDLPPGDGGCVDMSVPSLPNTRADLVATVAYPEANCSWERRVTLRISGGRVVVVHSERARYRPGDTLRARVFALKADLTPAHGMIEEIWIEGPPGAWEGTRVAQWTRVRSKMGLAQVQHEIDEQAPPGKWTVRARLADGSQGSSSFWVGNYDLPPFQLSVRHAPRVLRTSERLVWTVCVRYPWSEAVEGMLVIRLRGAGAGAASPGVRTAVRLRAPRACHRHAAAARRVGLNGDQPPRVVVADFSFQEEGTRIWQNTTVVSQVVDKAVFLEFLTKHSAVVTPGLPYKLKVKATRWDNKPASRERVRVCRLATRGDDAAETNKPTCNSADTDANGVARVMFAGEDEGSPFYRFEASLFNDSSVTSGQVTLGTRRARTLAALGPLRADARGARTVIPLYLSLANATEPITVHFVVIIRGGIIYRWGATTQCPIASSTNHFQVAARNTKCNEPMPLTDIRNKSNDHDRLSDYFNRIVSRQQKTKTANERNKVNDGTNRNERFDKLKHTYDLERSKTQERYNEYLSRYMSFTNKSMSYNKNQIDSNDINKNTDNQEKGPDDDDVSDALLDRDLLRVMLPIKVTQQMCPDSNLIAYFYYNGEFVSASKHFEMDDCFVNKVDLTWQPRQVLPGATTSIQISTPGPALCALTVLDTASRSNSATVKDAVVSGLKKMMDAHRNLTEYDAAGDCFMNVDSPEMPASSLELAATWLASAGVRAVGDMPVRRQCSPEAAAFTDEGTQSRSDFSESWLWRLVTVGANSSMSTSAKAPDSITRFEANAVCLSKTGISVAEPAVLQVFREFFIHADSARRLRRGDTAIIRYRLFNYLYDPLSVQIQILTDPHLKGPSDLVESVCVPPRASTARRVEVTASGQGGGRVIVRAKAVSDGGCGNKTRVRGVSDEVVIRITVEPEGIPVHEQKSTLLCGTGTGASLSSSSEVSWNWTQVEAVPGTESLTVWAIGNITGPLLADADSLVLLPRGCGEQNMARLATNLLSLSHLHPTCAAAASAREHVARGFTRQMQYIHPSGGFSAFGPSDPVASTWLTAFCLRYLRRAHQMLWPGLAVPPAVERAESWLLDQQMENGCFRNQGQLFHRELKGGLNEDGEIASVALTAYVITSLIESTSPLPSRVIKNTLSCLRAFPPLKYHTPTRIYAHSLLAYAFIRLKRYEEELMKSNEASWLLEKSLENEGLIGVMELVKMGTREGEFLWWETNSLSTSVEATSYALLALRQSPTTLQQFGVGAVRWLSAHRGPAGGFVSTQDTLVALEALTAWSSLQQTPANLTVTATSRRAETAALPAGMMVPAVMKMEGDSVHIKVEGGGCALVQATRSYNLAEAEAAATPYKRLWLQLAIQTDGEFDCDSQGHCYCAAVVEACVLWTGQFPEMALLEVALPGGYEADAKLLYSQLHQPDSMLRRIELSASSSRVTFYLTSRDVARHACLRVHCTGPRTAAAPAHATIMDYYAPHVNDTQIYTIPEDCPARIAHDSSPEIKDNIFSRARSLTEPSEILINHDFTFEDIPEGIPLEDPLYENLKRNDDKTKEDVNEILPNDSEMHNKITSKKESNNRIKVVIADKLDFSEVKTGDETHKISNTSIFKEKDNKYDDETQVSRYETIIKQNANKISDTEINEQITNAARENEHNEVKELHRIEVRDDQHEHHRSDNPNLSEFHVIDTEKDLEVPSGVEGPVPAVLLPPPNFIPPPNYVRIPENSDSAAETFTELRPNSQTDDPTLLNTPLPLSYAPQPQNLAEPPQTLNLPSHNTSPPQNLVPPPQILFLAPQNSALPSQSLMPPLQSFAPEEFRWQNYARYGDYRIPYYGRTDQRSSATG